MKALIITLAMIVASLGSQAQNKTVKATVCKGITKAGKPCKKHTKNANGYCQFHQPIKK